MLRCGSTGEVVVNPVEIKSVWCTASTMRTNGFSRLSAAYWCELMSEISTNDGDETLTIISIRSFFGVKIDCVIIILSECGCADMVNTWIGPLENEFTFFAFISASNRWDAFKKKIRNDRFQNRAFQFDIHKLKAEKKREMVFENGQTIIFG